MKHGRRLLMKFSNIVQKHALQRGAYNQSISQSISQTLCVRRFSYTIYIPHNKKVLKAKHPPPHTNTHIHTLIKRKKDFCTTFHAAPFMHIGVQEIIRQTYFAQGQQAEQMKHKQRPVSLLRAEPGHSHLCAHLRAKTGD